MNLFARKSVEKTARYLSIFRSVSMHKILQLVELFVLSSMDRDISSLQGTKLS